MIDLLVAVAVVVVVAVVVAVVVVVVRLLIAVGHLQKLVFILSLVFSLIFFEQSSAETGKLQIRKSIRHDEFMFFLFY